MTGFADRKVAADAFEVRVMERLNATGYQAFRFGQAQLSDECRSLLIKFEDGSGRPCLIRWMPDIITFRRDIGGRVWVALIDAKFCDDDRPNYAVEMSAAETAEAFTDRLYTPTFFVFSGGKVLTPREVRQRGKPGPTPAVGKGSGTPYLLIDKKYARPFEELFPPAVCSDSGRSA